VDEEWLKEPPMICIAINPGARKLIKGTPNIFDLVLPIARDKTKRNNSDETIGDKRV
jgi:hypothetical protein